MTFESAKPTSAILKWTGSNRSENVEMMLRLTVQHVSRDRIQQQQANTFRMVNTDVQVVTGDAVGWFQLEDLIPGASYLAQLVADIGSSELKNISNVVHFITPRDGTQYKLISIVQLMTQCELK